MQYPAGHEPVPPEHRRAILASSLGALFGWYDFFLYGVLAPVLAGVFFGGAGDGGAWVATLLAFAAGFVVRPLGALYFGRLGDLIGRKYSFLVTLLLMGGATFAIGLLPGESTLGVAAPVALVVLRLLQGLAIGGEYAGVATYVAEHAPARRLGFYTGWIQATASLGFLMALLVVVGLRTLLGEHAFLQWGWRVPFLLSILLVAVGIWARLSLQESPLYRRLKLEGSTARRPLAEALGQRPNRRMIWIALFGLVAGQAVVWYAGQFQALYFLTLQLKVDETTASLMMCAALALAAPLFVVFGALSDRIGRKPIILCGCLLAALAYLPLFKALTWAANPALAAAQQQVVTTLSVDPKTCGWVLDAAGAGGLGGCEAAKRRLSERAVRYTTVEGSGPAAAVTVAGVRVNTPADDAPTRQRLDAALDAAGYPSQADPAQIDHLRVIGVLLLLLVFVAMVYGPLAAQLVEMFPARVRCTSVGASYHLGNGWFGGLLPSAALQIAAQTGDPYSGLWYPIAIALITCGVGLVCVSDRRGSL